MVVKAKRGGTVTFVDASASSSTTPTSTCCASSSASTSAPARTRSPIVKPGQKVEKGEVIADGASTKQGELASARTSWSRSTPSTGTTSRTPSSSTSVWSRTTSFTSIHIDAFDVEIRETKLGREEFTRDIPNVSEKMLRNLDDSGIIRLGARVGPGDILVGKVSPKSKTELTPKRSCCTRSSAAPART
jgi:DNA-directed RNA polymerase subunit beta